MNKNKWYGLIVCGCLGVGAFAFGEGKMKTGATNAIPQLASLKAEERLKLLDKTVNDRYSLQSELIAQLDASKSKEVTFSAAFLLGIYRMEDSVPTLAKIITMESDVMLHASAEPRWDQYPIVEALIRIGNPAVPEMIKNIETSKDKKVRELSARVIKYVMGPDIAKIVLEKAMKDKSDAVKANFKAAIESMRAPRVSEVKPSAKRDGLPKLLPVIKEPLEGPRE